MVCVVNRSGKNNLFYKVFETNMWIHSGLKIEKQTLINAINKTRYILESINMKVLKFHTKSKE